MYSVRRLWLQTEKGRALTDTDVSDLARIRRILCLPADAVSKAQMETSGKMLEEAIRWGAGGATAQRDGTGGLQLQLGHDAVGLAGWAVELWKMKPWDVQAEAGRIVK